jgi:hypothetical protein
MSTRIESAHIVCDCCHRRSPSQPGIKAARTYARSIDWAVTGGGSADLCPICIAETEPCCSVTASHHHPDTRGTR